MFLKIFPNKYVIVLALILFFGIIIFKENVRFFKVKATAEAKCHWKISINSNRPKGVSMSGEHNLGSCLATCVSIPECNGFDYVAEKSVVSNCFLHFLNNSFPVLYGNAVGVVNYQRLCSDVKTGMLKEQEEAKFCKWVEKKGIYGKDELMMHGVSDLEKCKEACLMSWNCKGINWDENEFDAFKKCSLTTETAFRVDRSGIKHFANKCDKESADKSLKMLITDCSWQMFKDTTARSTKLMESFDSLETCKDSCQADPFCYSFEWNSIQKGCFYSISFDTIQQYGVNHYQYKCLQV